MQSPWGRIVVGLLLSQGLFIGLRQLVTSGFIAVQGEQGGAWASSSVAGLSLWLTLQAIAVGLSGFLVGTTQRHAFLLGALMGLWNGIVSTFLQNIPNPAEHTTLLYSQPLLHALIAGLGALGGRLLFQPPTAPALPGMVKTEPKDRARSRKPRNLLRGPVHWMRILVGVVIVVLGCLSASAIFSFIMELGRGRLQTASYLEDRVLVWEVRILIILAGALLAGASTANGFKQGLFVGVISFGILMVFPRFTATVDMVLYTFLSTLGASIVGGWFGGQLLPPVVRYSRLRRPGSLAM